MNRLKSYILILEIECSAKYVFFLVIQKASNIFYSISGFLVHKSPKFYIEEIDFKTHQIVLSS